MKPRILDKDIPEGRCRCPVCDGTGIVPLTEKEKTYSWNRGCETTKCTNCGGQYMYSSAMGYVKPNKDNVGCTHSYHSKKVGNCLHEYTCEQCGDRYQIDSGG